MLSKKLPKKLILSRSHNIQFLYFPLPLFFLLSAMAQSYILKFIYVTNLLNKNLKTYTAWDLDKENIWYPWEIIKPCLNQVKSKLYIF